MSCARCGDVCHCDSEVYPPLPARRPRARFEPHCDQGQRATLLVDPEPVDTSEEQFSASLEPGAPAVTSVRPKFVIDAAAEQAVDRVDTRAPDEPAHTAMAAASSTPEISITEVQEPPPLGAPEVTPDVDLTTTTDVGEGRPDSWKHEVAARLNSYRARRKPRPPRYPSLRLKFDPPEIRSTPYSNAAEVPAPRQLERSPVARYQEPTVPVVTTETEPLYTPPVETGRIIEFPRLYSNPAPPTYELAEPVMEAPRIVEVPEVAPPPPALGGIILPAEEKEPERRPGFEIPLQSAAMSRRVLAMATDGSIVSAACALFGYIVFKIAGTISPSWAVLEMCVIVAAVFWSGYEYLLLIYTGSTPGLRLAGLRLSHFDGAPVSRRMRKWRVLACVLSAVSLGLGFAWSYLDEDALCWHDRITRTYLAPIK